MEEEKLQTLSLHILMQLDRQITTIHKLRYKNVQDKETLALKWNYTALFAAIIGLYLFAAGVFFGFASGSSGWITVLVSAIPGTVGALFFVRADQAYQLADQALSQLIKDEEQALERKFAQFTDLLIRTTSKGIQEKHAPDIARKKLQLSLREQVRPEAEQSDQRKKLVLVAIICSFTATIVTGLVFAFPRIRKHIGCS